MAVTVTDTRTVFAGATTGNGQADSITDWTGPGGLTVDTSVYAESSASLSYALNIATGTTYLTISSLNLSNSMIYIQSYNAALQGGWDSGGTHNTYHGIYVYDGTNEAIFHMSGYDKDVFKHADGQVQFQCLLIDGAHASQWNTDGHVTMLAGAFTDLNLSAITRVGVYYETLSKGLGGGKTIYTDIMRYGNNGLTITGGTSGGGEGTFAEIAVEDRSTGDGKAHGVLREYSTGIYGVQGPLTFGQTVTGDNYFSDDGVVVAFEDRPVADDKYFFNVVGNGTGTNYFVLTNSTITTAGPFVTCDFSDAGINTLTITGCSFTGLGNSISFANDAATSGQTVSGNTFQGCGQIDPGTVTFSNNTLTNTTDASGGLLIDSDGTTDISSLTFNSDGTGHGILVNTAGTYTFSNFTYNNYSTSNETTDSVINNTSLGLVTINVSSGGSPTYKNTDFETNAVWSYNANTTTWVDETTDMNDSDPNDVLLPPQQAGTAGDVIYFGHSSKFTAVQVNVGTAGVYSNVTITWEYSDGASGWNTLTVTDNTTNFTATGSNAVYFTDPGASWQQDTVNGISGKYWIRAITSFPGGQSVTTPPTATEGGVGAVIVQNTVTIQITGVIEGARCRIENASTGEAYLSAEANSSGVASVSLNHPGGNITVNAKARLVGYLPFETTTTWEDGANLTVGAVWQVDSISDKVDTSGYG